MWALIVLWIYFFLKKYIGHYKIHRKKRGWFGCWFVSFFVCLREKSLFIMFSVFYYIYIYPKRHEWFQTFFSKDYSKSSGIKVSKDCEIKSQHFHCPSACLCLNTYGNICGNWGKSQVYLKREDRSKKYLLKDLKILIEAREFFHTVRKLPWKNLTCTVSVHNERWNVDTLGTRT